MLTLSADQLLLKQTAKSYLDQKSPASRMRALRDSEDEVGFSRGIWSEMAAMGWTGIIFPEDFGGTAMGYGELGVVLEECGRVLAPEPFVSTVLLAGNAILLGGSKVLKKDTLPAVCSGHRILAMALQEQGRFSPYAIATTAVRDGDHYRIDGQKQFVLDGHVADQLVVLARTAGDPCDRDGLTLFLVDSGAEGLLVQRTLMVDGRNAADIAFRGVNVSATRTLGALSEGANLLDEVIARAVIGLSAEMVGTFSEAFDRTLSYLKEREQFGVKIASFQALRHRVVDMWCELELARSVVREALSALDETRDDVQLMASAAKARCSDVSSLITREALQMHGGIGVTDDHDIGLFFKRAKSAELTLGDAIYHRDRYAQLRGF